MGPPEHRVLAVVGVTCTAWILLPLLERLIPGITDAGVAVAGALSGTPAACSAGSASALPSSGISILWG